MVSNVGADPITLGGLLVAFAKQGGATVNGNQLTQGIITDGYLPTLGDSTNSWIALFKKVHDTYDAKAPFDGNVLYGEAVGYAFVQAMVKAGKNPTRADLVNAINGGLPQGPGLAPYAYSASDHSGITGAFIGVIQNGAIVQQGPVLVTDATATGAVSPYTGTEQAAPGQRDAVGHGQAAATIMRTGAGLPLPGGSPAGGGPAPGTSRARRWPERGGRSGPGRPGGRPARIQNGGERCERRSEPAARREP